jgi:hypothetical protein
MTPGTKQHLRNKGILTQSCIKYFQCLIALQHKISDQLTI